MKEDPKCPSHRSGFHYIDNQGSCHNCGWPMDKQWYELYAGKTTDEEWEKKIADWFTKHLAWN